MVFNDTLSRVEFASEPSVSPISLHFVLISLHEF